MSEDYKKIALEDVKKGQKVRIVTNHRTFMSTYEGVVSGVDPEETCISFGSNGDGKTLFFSPISDTTIFLLEDAPKPKVVRTEKVTITHYDDGTTTTQTSVDEIPMVIETLEQFEGYAVILKQVLLKDTDGDYWAYRDGQWRWTFGTLFPGITWHTPTALETIEQSLPMTIVENVGD